MSPTWVTLFTFAGTTLFVGGAVSAIYEIFFRYPAALRQRLSGVGGKTKGDQGASLLDIKQLVESAKTQSDWRTWARSIVEQSGVRVQVKTLLILSFSLAATLALAAGIASQRWWGAELACAAGFAIPSAYVWSQRRARIRRMTVQFPDALDAISRAVRAGQTVPAAFQMVAADFPMPICAEFRYCYEQQNLGLSYDAALRNLTQRTGIMELRILVVALLVQSRSGGNLSELLANLSTTVRKRLVLQQKVKALTGEGRMQAAVLITLPVVVFIAMYFLNRDYAQILLDRPWLLAGCLVSQTVGAAVIYKLIQIDY